jgi:hypothetical protein
MIDIIDPNELDVASHRHEYPSGPVGATLLPPHSCMRPRALWIRKRISSRRSQGTLHGHWAHLG